MQTLIPILLVSGALVMSQGVCNGAADEERAQGLPLSTAQDLTDTGRLADQTAATRTAQHRGLLSDGRGTMASRFDFPEMAKDSLGAAWAHRTPTERAEFVHLFAAFLKKAVLSRIEPYSKTITDPADRGDESYAKVRSKGQGRGMPRSSGWRETRPRRRSGARSRRPEGEQFTSTTCSIGGNASGRSTI